MGMFGPSLGLHFAFSTDVYVPPGGYSRHLGMSLFLTLGKFVITPAMVRLDRSRPPAPEHGR